MVGGFTWKKNLEYGVQLFEIILRDNPEARLFLVGTGPVPESKQNLLLPLGDSIYIVERESPDKMTRWYQTCPFLLSTSRYEGGRSFAILEAQSEGMAVFTTDIPSSRETLFRLQEWHPVKWC
jgi:glycosyltransferase involved in cell wall biosynthesis